MKVCMFFVNLGTNLTSLSEVNRNHVCVFNDLGKSRACCDCESVDLLKVNFYDTCSLLCFYW